MLIVIILSFYSQINLNIDKNKAECYNRVKYGTERDVNFMTRDWSLYLPYFFEMFVNFSVYIIICISLYFFISKKDDKYIEKSVGVIEKILTFGLIPITLILLFLMFTYNGFSAIAGEILALFPFVCLIWLINAIVKYVKVRKTNDIDERKKLKKNLIAAVIVTSLEFIMFIFLIVVVLGVLRGMT